MLNQIVQRACDFEKPKAKSTPPTITTTTTTTTTAYRSSKKSQAKAKANDEAFIEKEVDQVLLEPVVSEAAYPNLVSINNQTNLLKICKLKMVMSKVQIKLKAIYLAKG